MSVSWCPTYLPPPRPPSPPSPHTPSIPLTNQSSQHKRGQLLENDGVARLVSFKHLSEEKTETEKSVTTWRIPSASSCPADWFLHLVRQQLLHGVRRHAGRLQLLARLGGSFPFHQRFGLSQEVRHQDLKDRQSRRLRKASATAACALRVIIKARGGGRRRSGHH